MMETFKNICQCINMHDRTGCITMPVSLPSTNEATWGDIWVLFNKKTQIICHDTHMYCYSHGIKHLLEDS